MTHTARMLLAAGLALLMAGAFSGPAWSQSKGGGRIVCWKDKNGKVVGCGDSVPPEYQSSATKEMDKRGVTRRTTESAEEAARRRAQEREAALQKAEEQKRLAAQQRQDAALLNTFSSAQEIDQKRDRDLQQIDMQIDQLRMSLKNATERYNEAKARSSKPASDKKTAEALKDDVAKAEAERKRLEQAITARMQEKEDIRDRYAEQKKRYLELKAGGGARPAAATTTAAGKK